MFNNLYAAANEIRTLLMPFAFVLCVIGIGEMGWRAGSDPRAVLGALIKTIIIVALIAAYPDDDGDRGQKAFLDIRQQFTDARDAKFVQLLRSHVENQPSDSLTEHRQDRASRHRIFLPGYRAIHALGAAVLSRIRHRRVSLPSRRC